jgi:hypothetical protein
MPAAIVKYPIVGICPNIELQHMKVRLELVYHAFQIKSIGNGTRTRGSEG